MHISAPSTTTRNSGYKRYKALTRGKIPLSRSQHILLAPLVGISVHPAHYNDSKLKKVGANPSELWRVPYASSTLGPYSSLFTVIPASFYRTNTGSCFYSLIAFCWHRPSFLRKEALYFH
jgi:hypothetical protein